MKVFLLILLLLVGGYIAWVGSAWFRGEAVAYFDVARGRYEILTYGLPFYTKPEADRILWERYGIRDRRVAGCMVSWEAVAYWYAYNQVVMHAANRKFGHDVFKETLDEVARKASARKRI